MAKKKRRRNPPWMKFFVDDFLAAVLDFSCEEVGAYFLLLCQQWQRGYLPGSLPGSQGGDISRLARICRLSSSEFEPVWEALKVKFEQDSDGNWVNLKMQEVRREQFTAYERQCRGGEATTQATPQATSQVATQALCSGSITSSSKDVSEGNDRDQAPSARAVSPAPVGEDFDQFWKDYPPRNGKRREKAKARNEWAKLSQDQKERALKAAEIYAQHETYIKDAFRWLRDKSFEDWQDPPDISANRGLRPENERARQAVLDMIHQHDAGGENGQTATSGEALGPDDCPF